MSNDTPLIDTPGLRELMQARPELFEWSGAADRYCLRWYDTGRGYSDWGVFHLYDAETGWEYLRGNTDYEAAAVIEKRLREALDEHFAPLAWGLANRRVHPMRWYVWTEKETKHGT